MADKSAKKAEKLRNAAEKKAQKEAQKLQKKLEKEAAVARKKEQKLKRSGKNGMWLREFAKEYT